jgi:hypothetical protein
LQDESKKYINWFDGGVPYGIAQYAINTTFTNMLLMERWDNYLDPIREFLHVPVDSIIMEAACRDYKITVPLSNGGVGKYSASNDDEMSKSYKKWNYDEYIKFQEDVRGAVSCPIDFYYSTRNKEKLNCKN